MKGLGTNVVQDVKHCWFNRKLTTILWKCFKQRQRKFIVTFLFECLLPIGVIILLAYINKTSKLTLDNLENEWNDLPQYVKVEFAGCSPAKPLISAGILDWLQGSLCDSFDKQFETMNCYPRTPIQMNYVARILNHSTQDYGKTGAYVAFSKIFCGDHDSRSRYVLSSYATYSHNINPEHNCKAAKNLFNYWSQQNILRVIESTYYYYPHNNKIVEIIKNVKKNFENIKKLKEASKIWRENFSEKLAVHLSQSEFRRNSQIFIAKCKENNGAKCPAGKEKECRRQLFRCQAFNQFHKSSKGWSLFINITNVAFVLAESLIDCMKFPKFFHVNSEEEVYSKAHASKSAIGIIITGIKNSTTIENVGHVKLKVIKGELKDEYNYQSSEISTVTIYDMFLRGIMDVLTGEKVSEGVTTQKIFRPCSLRPIPLSTTMQIVYSAVEVLLIICWMPTFCSTVIAIVAEKEKRLTFTLTLMSVRKSQIWFGWFVYMFPLLAIISLATTFFFDFFKVLEYSSLVLFFLMLILYSIVCTLQAFLLATIFQTTKLASIITPLVYLFGTIIRYFLNKNTPRILLWTVSLIPQAAFYLALKTAFHFEDEELGFTWETVSMSWELHTTGFEIIVTLIFTGLLFILCMIYIDSVFPGEYGIAQVWYFPFTKQYWCDQPNEREDVKNPQQKNNNNTDYFESDPENFNVGIEIIELCKKYKSNGPVVVNGLNLTFYVDQITAFLGHNGAGKTTTLSIIAGIFPQTSGKVIINGYNTQTAPEMALRSLGLCPQHNVLFDYLTVEEHIILYGGFKATNEENTVEGRKIILNTVNLYEKREYLVTALSGGMKRRLSVGLAFLGNPTAVILDEPTAGVDPYARREIWDVILAHKEGKAIILTTHHMDEAEILGDRIAIISHGQLKCCGTNLFLKRVLGKGYVLNLCLAPGHNGDSTMLTEFINKYVANSKLIKQTKEEITFELPQSACDSGEFEVLFKNLEDNKAKLNVDNYGINNTSLESIFLSFIESVPAAPNKEDTESRKICCFKKSKPKASIYVEQTQSNEPSQLIAKQNQTNNVCNQEISLCMNETEAMYNTYTTRNMSNKDTYENTYHVNEPRNRGVCLWLTQFFSVFIKRATFSFRGFATLCGQYVVPTFLIIVSIILYHKYIKIKRPSDDVTFSTKEYHPWNLLFFPENLHVFYSNENSSNTVVSKYEEMIQTPLGLGGTRCMNPSVYQIPGYPCDRSIVPGEWTTFRAPVNNTARCDQLPEFTTWPVRRRLETTDYLYKVQETTTKFWLAEPDKRFRNSRLGGFSFGTELSFDEQNGQIETVEFFKQLFNLNDPPEFWMAINEFLINGGASASSVTILWHRNDSLQDAISYLGILANLMYRTNVRNPENTGLSLYINATRLLEDDEGISPIRNWVTTGVYTLIKQAFTLAICSVLVFLVDERVSVSKYLQVISGLQPVIYWMANFVWDMINLVLLIGITLILLRIIEWWEYVAMSQIYIFTLFLFTFCCTALVMMYVLSHWGTSPGKYLLLVFITIELLTDLTEVFVRISGSYPKKNPDKTIRKKNGIDYLATFLSTCMAVLPHYSFGKGLQHIFEFKDNLTEHHRDKKIAETLWLSVKPDFINQISCLIVYTVILILLEYSPITFQFILSIFYRLFKLPKSLPSIEDADVANEKERILNDKEKTDAVHIKNLTKMYSRNIFGHLTAVKNVCLGMRSGECFGLLGVNGAGKTTSFKMMTGEIVPTAGSIFIHKYSIQRRKYKALQKVGYCPQFNGFGEKFTSREVLRLHARINGIPRKHVESIIEAYMESVSLLPHADKLSGDMSGGNKRKLSTCIALIGNPDVIFLDEPTSGMDTAARRELWDCINSVVARGKCVVLTSHSLEECEALCQRACIMVSGNLRCLGSIQHLKLKFGTGYTISLKTFKGNKKVSALKAYMDKLTEAKQTTEHGQHLEYEVPFIVPLYKVFKMLQTAKLHRHLIEDYSINQTTLDDVFIDFARGDPKL